MASTKEIKHRIKSANSTKKIISAMELVSVVKMQKAVRKNLASREFSGLSYELLKEVCAGIDTSVHPLLKNKAGNRKLVIVITSDRGLCGALNTRIIREAVNEAEGYETSYIAIGKKCRDFLAARNYNIIASYQSLGDDLRFNRILPIIQGITNDYLADKYDKVTVVYTHFKSSLSQIAKVRQLLPFEIDLSNEKSDNIIFDPNKNEIVNTLIPRVLETEIWQYVLEAAASEHSARMVAMKNANENAEDLIFDLTLSYNQTRQAGITSEIAEISAGKMTLEA